jgi:hypothetical protein
MFVWYATAIHGGIPGATMWKNAIDFACLKIGDYNTDGPHWDANIQFAGECARQGLPIETWAYLYGYGDGEPLYLKGQYRKMIGALAGTTIPLPRLVLDLEAEYERNISAGFLAGLGQAIPPTVSLGCTVIPILPFRNRMALAVAENFGPVIPQMYWKAFSDPWRDWNNLIPDWEHGPYGHGWARGWTEAAVSFTGNPNPTLAELQAFVAVLAGHGVKTILWWKWEDAPVDFWLWLREEKKKRDAAKV